MNKYDLSLFDDCRPVQCRKLWARVATFFLQALSNTLSVWYECADKISSQRAWIPSGAGCKYRRWHAYIRVVMRMFWREPCTGRMDHIWQSSLISYTQYVPCVTEHVHTYGIARPLSGVKKGNLVEMTIMGCGGMKDYCLRACDFSDQFWQKCSVF